MHNFRSDPKASFGKMVPQILNSQSSLRRYDFSFYARKTSKSSDAINCVIPLEAEFDIVSRHGPAESKTSAMENAEMILVLRDCIEAVLTDTFPFFVCINIPGLSELVFDWCKISQDRMLRNRIFMDLCKRPKKQKKPQQDDVVERLLKNVPEVAADPGFKALENFLRNEVLKLGYLAMTSAPFSGKMHSLSVVSSFISSASNITLASSSSSSSSLSTGSSSDGKSNDMITANSLITMLAELNAALRDAGVNTDNIIIDPFFYAKQCNGLVFQARAGSYIDPGDIIASGYRYDNIVTTKEHPISGIGLVLHVDALQQLLASIRKGSSSTTTTSSSSAKNASTLSTSPAPRDKSGNAKQKKGVQAGQGTFSTSISASGCNNSTAGMGQNFSSSSLAGIAERKLCGGSGGDFRPTQKVVVFSVTDSWVPVEMAARLWRQQIHTEIVTGCKSKDSCMAVALAKMADWTVEVTESYRNTHKVALRRIDPTTTSNKPRTEIITEAASIIIQEALFNDYVASNPDRFSRGAHAFASAGGYTSTSPPPPVSSQASMGAGGAFVAGQAPSLKDSAGSRFKVEVLGSRPKEWEKKIIIKCQNHLALSLEGIHIDNTIPCYALELPFEEICEFLNWSMDCNANLSSFSASSSSSRAKGRKSTATEENETVRRKLRQDLLSKIASSRDQTIIIISLAERSFNQFVILGQTQIDNIQKMYSRPKKIKKKTKKAILVDVS